VFCFHISHDAASDRCTALGDLPWMWLSCSICEGSIRSKGRSQHQAAVVYQKVRTNDPLAYNAITTMKSILREEVDDLTPIEVAEKKTGDPKAACFFDL
jgi:hypothetical protein